MKLIAWYDNEYGFTCNMMRLLAYIAEVNAWYDNEYGFTCNMMRLLAYIAEVKG